MILIKTHDTIKIGEPRWKVRESKLVSLERQNKSDLIEIRCWR